jgi:hypothetical protein
MSSGGPHIETGALSQQIDAVSREAAALSDAFTRARRIRQLLALAVLVLIVVVCAVFYNMGRRLMSQENLNTLADQARERFEKNREKYLDHVQLLVKNSGPVLSEAFQEQAKKDMPAIMNAVEKERQPLMDSLQKQLEKKLEDHYKNVVEKYRSMIEQEFPSIKDPKQHERMVENLRVAIDKLVKKYYVDEMHDLLVQIFDELEKFPAADKPKKGDVALEDQFKATFLQLAQDRFTSKEGVTQEK